MAEDGKAELGLVGRLFGSFHRTFWVVNAFELFERGAYYGTMSIMALHVTKNILAGYEFADAIWGSLYAMMIIAMYFIPLISGALAEKYGYKTMLAFAFGMMTAGYFLLFTVRPGQLGYLVLVLIIMTIGAGAFKPIISASIAHVTAEEKRNLAYSIYYWMINLGASVLPFILGWAFPAQALWYYVFIVSGFLCVCNWVILLTLYKDPVSPRPELSVGRALKRIIPALKDKKFAILLIIYSGFWFMFAYNHTFLQRNMDMFGRMPGDFPVQWIQVFNPLTIIIAGPFLGKAVERYKSLNVMMLGIIIFCLGLAINGFSNGSFLFVAGIVIFSIGEFIVHPGFISYVSKIAPKDMVAIYMASIFLSTGLGQILGGAVGGVWYNVFATFMLRPKFFIALVIVVGIITLVAFMYYNRWTIRLARREDISLPVERNVWTRPVTPVVALLFIPVVLGVGWGLGTSPLAEDEGVTGREVDWSRYELVTQDIGSESGTTMEGDATEVRFTVPEDNVANVTFTLSWTDEPATGGLIGVRFTNEPDTFSFEVTPPNGTMITSQSVSNPQGGTGEVEVRVSLAPLPAEEPFYNLTGEFIVLVSCEQAGNHVPLVSIGGVREVADTGNDWTLTGEAEHYVRSDQ